MRRLALLTAIAAIAAAPAMAQPKPAAPAVAPGPAPAASSAPAPSEAALREAASLTELLGTQNSVESFVALVRERIVALLVNASHKPQAEVAQSVDELLMPDIRSHAAELRNAVTNIWAAHFTVQEMKDLHAFYTTPLGAKLVRVQPEIAQQTQAFGRSWAEKYTKETADKHIDDLRSRGLVPGPAAAPAPGPLP